MRNSPRTIVKAMVARKIAPLLSALKANAARAWPKLAGVPAYVIFTDRTLIEMAERRRDVGPDGGHHRVGAKKLERLLARRS